MRVATRRTGDRLPQPARPMAPEPTARPTGPPPGLWAVYQDRERALAALPTSDRLARLKDAARALVRAALATRGAAAEAAVSPGRFRVLLRVAAVNEAVESLTLARLAQQTGIDVLRQLDHLRGLLLDLFC